MLELPFSQAWVASGTLTLARVGGLASFAPIFGSQVIPPRVRLLIALGLTAALFPVVGERYGEVPRDFVPFTILMVRELLVGVLFGLVARFLFSALEVAGQLMGFQIGFSFIQAVDPQTQVESPFLGLFLNLVGMLVLLGMNGHHWYLQAIASSYDVYQGGTIVDGPMLEQMIRSAEGMFVIGLKLAAPVMVVMLIVDFLLGLLGRSAPQLQVLILGMPAKAIIGFILLAATVHSFVPFIGRHLGTLEREYAAYLALLR